MSAPELDKTAGRHPSQVHRPYWPRLLTFTFVAWLGSTLLGFQFYYRRPYTCAVCRADKEDVHCLGLKWSHQEETDCSRWYRANVEPSHAHVWLQCTYCRRFGIPGLWGGYGCTVGGPITGLSRTVQTQIYQHFEDRFEAKRLFIRLGQLDKEGYRMWNGLMRWVDEAYPGTWHDWWEKVKDNPDP